MNGRRKKLNAAAGMFILAILLAYAFRFLGKGAFCPTLFSYFRSFIYIGMFTVWGLSVRQRIVQKQARRFLIGIAALLIFWITLRSAKYFVFWQADILRYLWYLFYLPMLFVPMMAVMISLSLGWQDDFKLPRAVWILWAVSAALFLLVMTNDLHQAVFTFPQNSEVWTDSEHGYSWGYYLVVSWQIFCAVTALIIMGIKCRKHGDCKALLPIVPLAAAIAYSALYYAGVPWLRYLFGDVAVFQSLMYILAFEACIACGYIHSNSRYAELFASSVGTSVQIADNEYNIRYAAINTEHISPSDIKNAENAPFELDNGHMLHVMPVSGGYAVWTEDVSGLLKLREISESLSEELKERNELLRYEYKREAKHHAVEEQNRLYDLLRSATQKQIDRIAVLMKEYRNVCETSPEASSELLAEIAVLCSYIKRRKHLTLLADRERKMPVSETERAFSESLQTLKLLNVKGMMYIDDTLSDISGISSAAVFDFYEEVIENALHNLKSVQLSLANTGTLRFSMNVRCGADLSAFAEKDGVIYEKDDEYQRLVFFPEGGGIE